MLHTNWRPGASGHLTVSVPRDQVAEVEWVYAIGRRLNLFADNHAEGWIRITDLLS